MSVSSAVALALVIVSVVMTALTNTWTNSLIWVAWAFAVVYIVGPVVKK